MLRLNHILISYLQAELLKEKLGFNEVFNCREETDLKASLKMSEKRLCLMMENWKVFSIFFVHFNFLGKNKAESKVDSNLFPYSLWFS